MSFNILAVGSGHSFAGFLEEFLKIEGHGILRAESAEEAVAKTRQFQPDLILLDDRLKGVSCLALLSELLMEQASAAVILLAGNASIRDAVEAMKWGAAGYLERPLDYKDLKKAIDDQKALATI